MEDTLDLAQLKDLHAAATPGEWKSKWGFNGGGQRKFLVRGTGVDGDLLRYRNGDEDTDCIAALHNAFPALADRLEAAEADRDTLAAQNAALREALENVRRYAGLQDQHRQDGSEVCFDWCPRCKVDATLALPAPTALARLKAETRLGKIDGLLGQLISYILSIRSSNTCEWMRGLEDHVNLIAEERGDKDRVSFNGDGLSIIRIEVEAQHGS